MEKHIGHVTQVIGPVVDVRFEDGELPALNHAIEIDRQGKRLVVEVSQHIGDGSVRCIAMSSTDGLVRGCLAAFQGYVAQFGGIEDPAAFFVRGFRQVFGHVGALAEHQTVFVGNAVVHIHIGVGMLHFGDKTEGLGVGPAGEIPALAPFRCHKAGLVKGVVLRHLVQRYCRSVHRAKTSFRVVLCRHIDQVHFNAEAVIGMGNQHASVF